MTYSLLYAGHFPRLHPSDFRVRSLDGVGEDWPIDYGTLEPYYAQNDRMMGIAGLAGDPAYPPKVAVLRKESAPLVMALARVTVQCYYRYDRVMRSLNMEPRPSYPLGFEVESGDSSLFDPVRARGKIYRDVPGGPL